MCELGSVLEKAVTNTQVLPAAGFGPSMCAAAQLPAADCATCTK
jgi:hypothetical protein